MGFITTQTDHHTSQSLIVNAVRFENLTVAEVVLKSLKKKISKDSLCLIRTSNGNGNKKL